MWEDVAIEDFQTFDEVKAKGNSWKKNHVILANDKIQRRITFLHAFVENPAPSTLPYSGFSGIYWVRLVQEKPYDPTQQGDQEDDI